MTKETITIELTPEQVEKVELLNEKGIEVGDAIDMLFEFKNDVLVMSDQFIQQRLLKANEEKQALESQLEQVNSDIEIYSKLKETAMDVDQKTEILEDQYSEDRTYEIKAQDAKRKISWARDFFKF